MEFRKKIASARGFTLVELLITIAILAIIMGIAVPSYNQWVLKSGRADAKGVLMQSAQSLERCFTRYGAYNNANCALGQGDTVMSENDKYQLTATRVTANQFDLTAVPQGGQTGDTECGNFTLNHQGLKGANGGSDPAVVEKCW